MLFLAGLRFRLPNRRPKLQLPIDSEQRTVNIQTPSNAAIPAVPTARDILLRARPDLNDNNGSTTAICNASSDGLNIALCLIIHRPIASFETHAKILSDQPKINARGCCDSKKTCWSIQGNVGFAVAEHMVSRRATGEVETWLTNGPTQCIWLPSRLSTGWRWAILLCRRRVQGVE